MQAPYAVQAPTGGCTAYFLDDTRKRPPSLLAPCVAELYVRVVQYNIIIHNSSR